MTRYGDKIGKFEVGTIVYLDKTEEILVTVRFLPGSSYKNVPKEMIARAVANIVAVNCLEPLNEYAKGIEDVARGGFLISLEGWVRKNLRVYKAAMETTFLFMITAVFGMLVGTAAPTLIMPLVFLFFVLGIVLAALLCASTLL